jgi:serine/alanine adding enzyme
MSESIEISSSAPSLEWDAFVSSHPYSCHAHLAGWADVSRRVWGHESLMLTARASGGAIIGILPLTLVSSRVFGSHAVSVAFLNSGGPIGSPEAVRALVDYAREYTKRHGVSNLELRCRLPLPITDEPVRRKVGVTLALPSTHALLLKQLDSKVRSQTRRAAKEGATIQFGPAALDGFVRVFQMHMRDLGTPTMPADFFRVVADVFADSVEMASVSLLGTPIAGAFGFRWRNEFEITWASALHSYSRISPNMFLYASIMERCIASGLACFNFGRSTPGSGPHKFKMQWGGVETPLPWYFLGTKSSGGPSKEQAHFSLLRKVWTRLPLSIATRLGPHVVKCIP